MAREELFRKGNTLIDSICAEYFRSDYEGWNFPVRVEKDEKGSYSFYLTEEEGEEEERTRENYNALSAYRRLREGNTCPLDYPYCIEWCYQQRTENK